MNSPLSDVPLRRRTSTRRSELLESEFKDAYHAADSLMSRVAERVSRPKSTVSTQINRGLERLRERLSDSEALSA